MYCVLPYIHKVILLGLGWWTCGIVFEFLFAVSFLIWMSRSFMRCMDDGQEGTD